MTKRPFPFEPNICRQSKTHLNEYENDIIAMRDARERTLKMLLSGPRRLHSIVLSDGHDSHPIESETQPKSNFMQKLVTNYITVNGKKINENDRVLIRPVESSSSCFFCERRTNSTHQCMQCLEYYCSDCSLVNYESFEDRRICLSCS